MGPRECTERRGGKGVLSVGTPAPRAARGPERGEVGGGRGDEGLEHRGTASVAFSPRDLPPELQFVCVCVCAHACPVLACVRANVFWRGGSICVCAVCSSACVRHTLVWTQASETCLSGSRVRLFASIRCLAQTDELFPRLCRLLHRRNCPLPQCSAPHLQSLCPGRYPGTISTHSGFSSVITHLCARMCTRACSLGFTRVCLRTVDARACVFLCGCV